MYVYYNNCGKIEVLAEKEITSELPYIKVDFTDFSIHDKYYVLDGLLVQIPTISSRANKYFDYITKTWADFKSLEELKAEKLLQINSWRLAANQGYFIFLGYQIACDQLSRNDINNINGEVALTGELPTYFPKVWKAINNKYVDIPDVGTWTLFYKAMVQQGTTNFLHTQELKSQVASVTSQEELDAITW